MTYLTEGAVHFGKMYEPGPTFRPADGSEQESDFKKNGIEVGSCYKRGEPN